MLPLEYWIIVLPTAIAVFVCVVLHYEGLRLLNNMPVVGIRSRRRRIAYRAHADYLVGVFYLRRNDEDRDGS